MILDIGQSGVAVRVDEQAEELLSAFAAPEGPVPPRMSERLEAAQLHTMNPRSAASLPAK